MVSFLLRGADGQQMWGQQGSSVIGVIQFQAGDRPRESVVDSPCWVAGVEEWGWNRKVLHMPSSLGDGVWHLPSHQSRVPRGPFIGTRWAQQPQ
jgi:hypothetical protein